MLSLFAVVTGQSLIQYKLVPYPGLAAKTILCSQALFLSALRCRPSSSKCCRATLSPSLRLSLVATFKGARHLRIRLHAPIDSLSSLHPDLAAPWSPPERSEPRTFLITLPAIFRLRASTPFALSTAHSPPSDYHSLLPVIITE